MLLSYDGSPYQGWQLQPHGDTVQGRLEAALKTITGLSIRVHGSGRTDTAVHAHNQVAHFDLPAPRSLQKLRASLNGLCQPSVSIKNLLWVPADFHARHSARGKTYRYLIYNRPYPPVFAKPYCWWVRYPLDVGAMRLAARHLLGPHDFSSFRAIDCAAKSPLHTMNSVELEEGIWPDATLRITFQATGFLQHMARIITGTLVAIGGGRMAPDEMGRILQAKQRDLAGETAPGRGLHLLKVHYDLEEFPQLKVFDQTDDFWELQESMNSWPSP